MLPLPLGLPGLYFLGNRLYAFKELKNGGQHILEPMGKFNMQKFSKLRWDPWWNILSTLTGP